MQPTSTTEHAWLDRPKFMLESPLGQLGGTDNLVEFHTEMYSPNPLVIQGRGAGVDATAAGVLSDIVELAYTT